MNSWKLSALLACSMLSAAFALMKPTPVALVDAAKGTSDVIVIHVSKIEDDSEESENSTVYTLGCNAEVQSCIIPDKDETYTLQDSDVEVYHCQNVALFHSDKRVGIYCLQGVQ